MEKMKGELKAKKVDEYMKNKKRRRVAILGQKREI
jgi:hypothetical protein